MQQASLYIRHHMGIMPTPPPPNPPLLPLCFNGPAPEPLPLLLLLVDLLLATPAGALPLLKPSDDFLLPFLKNPLRPRNPPRPPLPPPRLLGSTFCDRTRAGAAAAACVTMSYQFLNLI